MRESCGCSHRGRDRLSLGRRTMRSRANITEYTVSMQCGLGRLTDMALSCEPLPPPCRVAPQRPPPEAYHAVRSTRWLVSCIRLLDGALRAVGEPSPCDGCPE